jgi:O-antigen/teichoic acid export membrane protein
MADQGVSSLSNVIVSIFVARSVSADGFGAFAVATLAYMLALGTARALVGEPLLSRYSSVELEVRRGLVPDLVGATLVVALIAVALVAVAGLSVGGAVGSCLVALTAVLPLLLVQDTLRYAFIVDRPGAALAVDLVWLAGVCVALPLAPSDAGPSWYVLAWGVAGGSGALVGLGIGRQRFTTPHPLRWFATNRAMGSRFFGEFVTGQAVGQIVMTSVGAISGLSVLGAVRATQVFYGPLNTVHQGIYLALVPEGAQTERPDHLRRLMIRASSVLVLVAVVWTCIGLALPDSWGVALLGDTWAEADELMPLMGLAMIVGSAATGGFAGVRSLGDARESLRARLRTVPPGLVLPLAGAFVAAGQGYALGFGLGHAASAVIWWVAFGNALARWRRRPGEPLSGVVAAPTSA